jgi:pimeloyl-ACP methyl ester carboxylesterase
VVLLHGLGRTALSMKRLEYALAKENYRVVNISYPSTRLPVEGAADNLDALLREQVPDPAVRMHFVTHSLGGIVLRRYLAERRPANLGRVVMLAPPNQGSELAARLKNNRLFKLLTGPAGQQLGGAPFLRELGPVDYELGIIAGDRSMNPLFSAWIPGPDDGKVSVASTRLEGMRDFLIVHHTHTWMMWREDVFKAVIRFLEAGRFGAGPGRFSGDAQLETLRRALPHPRKS